MQQLTQQIETVATFDATALEHAENVAFDRDGTIYVTLNRAAKVWRRGPDGTARVIAFPPSADGGTRVNGIVARRDHSVTVAVASDVVGVAGVWRIDPDGATSRLAAFPIAAGLNGMALDRRGMLYVADDTLGRV